MQSIDQAPLFISYFFYYSAGFVAGYIFTYELSLVAVSLSVLQHVGEFSTLFVSIFSASRLTVAPHCIQMCKLLAPTRRIQTQEFTDCCANVTA